MRTNPPVLLLSMPSDNPYLRLVVNGARDEAISFGWRPILIDPVTPATNQFDHGIKVVAALALSRTEEPLLRLRELTPTVVCISHGFQGFPIIRPDDASIGEAAAEHFHAIGISHGAFAPMPKWKFSSRRQQAFQGRMTLLGGYDHGIATGDSTTWGAWLRTLPTRTGVFCANDAVAVECLHAALKAGLRVPDDIAVLGVDNDRDLCELTDPPLSSISIFPLEIGRAAVRLAAHLHTNDAKNSTMTMGTNSIKVMARASTHSDLEWPSTLQQAMAFIRRHADTVLPVDAVAHAAGLPRRTLEYQSRRHLGCSVLEIVHRERLRRARALLRANNDEIGVIAEKCGFLSASAFTAMFRRFEGVTPSAFRNAYRGTTAHHHSDAPKTTCRTRKISISN